MSFVCRWLLCLAIVLGGCGSTAVDTVDDPVVDGPCHGPTTVPDGELPQPQCPEPEPVITSPTTTVGPWECPDEDYPIAFVATTWQPFTTPPASIDACGGGTLEGVGAAGVLLPSESIEGLEDTSILGLRVSRQPGGRFWHSTIQIPSSGVAAVTLESVTIGVDTAPDDLIAEWIAGEKDRNCNVAGGVPMVVRGVDGCRVGTSVVAWVDEVTSHRMTLAPSVAEPLSSEQLVLWLDTWADPT